MTFQVLSNLFIDSSVPKKVPSFRESKSVSDVWTYLEGPFLDALFWDNSHSASESKDDFGFVLYENKLLGVPRYENQGAWSRCVGMGVLLILYLHQNFFPSQTPHGPCQQHVLPGASRHVDRNQRLFRRIFHFRRVLPALRPGGHQSCPRLHQFRRHVGSRQLAVGVDLLVGVGIGEQLYFFRFLRRWRFCPGQCIGDCTRNIVNNVVKAPMILSRSPLLQDLSASRSKTEAILRDLRSHSWLDRATRALFIDLTVYNANVNLFCQVRLLAEFRPTGGVATSAVFQTVDLIRLRFTPLESFVIACQIAFCVFLLYFCVVELLQLRRDGE